MQFTVVTPSFNNLDPLRRCVASVRDQISSAPGLGIEHLIQDAGSAGIEEFANEHGAELFINGVRSRPPAPGSASGCRLRIFVERDEGMNDALNRGFARAQGDIISHLNSDEQYLEGALGLVAGWFEAHPLAEMMFGDFLVVDAGGRYLCGRQATLPTLRHTRAGGSLAVGTCATFFRRSVLNRGIRYDTSWKVIGDAVWIEALLRGGVRMGVRPGYLAAFQWDDANLSNRELAEQERQRRRASLHPAERFLAPLVKALYRARRWRADARALKAGGFAIYTAEDLSKRKTFRIENPTCKWPRPGGAPKKSINLFARLIPPA